MSYKIAIASGKGGTGKTTVSVNLLHHINKHTSVKAHLVDCDVEEPNDLLFFDGSTLLNSSESSIQVPKINKYNCVFCGKCEAYCEFNAITILKSKQYIDVDYDLCHACGACSLACTYDAIVEQASPIGVINHYKTEQGYKLTEGRLRIGSAMQTALIGSVKETVGTLDDLYLFDAPPGTSCSVVESVYDANYVVLVAEPTVFGLHDLKLMVELLRSLSLNFGVVVNKSGIGTQDIYSYLDVEQIELLSEIPFDKSYASLYAKGEIIQNRSLKMEEVYSCITDRIFHHLSINPPTKNKLA